MRRFTKRALHDGDVTSARSRGNRFTSPTAIEEQRWEEAQGGGFPPPPSPLPQITSASLGRQRQHLEFRRQADS